MRTTRLLALAGCIAAGACSSSRADTGTPASHDGAPGATSSRESATPPRDSATLYVIGVDVSGSQTPTRRQEGQDLVDGVVGRMTFGDKVTVVETYRARSDSAGQWSDSAPRARDPGTPTGNERNRLRNFQQRARMMAGGFFDIDPAHPVMTTDILAMLQRAADYAHAADGRRTVLLLVSDMLNATGELNMERPGGIPGADWITERKAQKQLPDLHGVCVVVAGADVSSKRGVAVREFWKCYFEAAGANFDDARFRTMIADPNAVSC